MSDAFRQLIEDVKLRLPIEEVVRERVPELRQQGRLWTACCPFHEEKTPSFKVDPSRSSWRCYGACGVGGDSLAFVERFDNLSFVESLELLAGRLGLSLPERSAAEGRRKGELDALYAVLQRAQDYYEKQLRSPQGKVGLDYLRQRGFGNETIAAFGLGFAGGDGDALTRRAIGAGLPLAHLEKVGLSRTNARGAPYDFFRQRLMFPIRDDRGRPVGFGARRLGDADPKSPKYVNTAETPLFHKGRLIYALDRAKDAARRQGHLVLMEGYTDVMAAHQAGLRQAVAVLGTAMTEDHASLLRRHGARRVSLVFDGDAAGRKACLRALDGLLPLGVAIDILAPPEGKDPCDLLLSDGGAERFEAELEQASDWMDFLLQGLLSLSGHERAVQLDEVLVLLTRVSRAVYREECFGQIAKVLNVDVGAVRDQYEMLPQRRRAQADRDSRARKQAAKPPVRRSGPVAAAPKHGVASTAANGPASTAAAKAGAREQSRTGPGHHEAREQSASYSRDDDESRIDSEYGGQSEDDISGSLPSEADWDNLKRADGPGAGQTSAEHGTLRPVPPSNRAQLANRAGSQSPSPAPAVAMDAQTLGAWQQVAGAVLIDQGLLPLLRDEVQFCEDADLTRLFEVLFALRDEGAESDESHLLTELADHPARRLVFSLKHGAETAESSRVLFESNLEYLRRTRENREVQRLKWVLAQPKTMDSEEEALRSAFAKLRAVKVPQDGAAEA